MCNHLLSLGKLLEEGCLVIFELDGIQPFHHRALAIELNDQVLLNQITIIHQFLELWFLFLTTLQDLLIPDFLELLKDSNKRVCSFSSLPPASCKHGLFQRDHELKLELVLEIGHSGFDFVLK
jgi:hypothetical protein